MFGKRDVEKPWRLHFHFFEWELHVAFIIIIINVITPVMHRKKSDKGDFGIDGLVFYVVTIKKRAFQYHLI